MLNIVSTPIGNLEDITLRAIKTLKEVDFIACEDTRHTWLLLQKLEINSKNSEWNSRLISFHSHSWKAKTEKILEILKEWKKIALVSDAWTPGISDPAYEITSQAIKEWIKISPIPWASAFLTALQASWIPINKFEYLGFSPSKKWRETFFKNLAEKKETVVFYESVHRIEKTLNQICRFLWEDREIVVARELTKLYEEFFHWTAKEAVEHFQNPKWEFVVILPAKEK